MGFITSTFSPDMVRTLVKRLEFQPLDGLALALGQLIGHHIAHVVPGVLIFVPGIAQADQQPADAPGAFLKNMAFTS